VTLLKRVCVRSNDGKRGDVFLEVKIGERSLGTVMELLKFTKKDFLILNYIFSKLSG
jgi:hypothetical protein